MIVAGTRGASASARDVAQAIADSGFSVHEVVSGGASGVDAQGEAWAHARGIPVRVFPALWREHGRSAGPIRNRAMADYADALVAIWDGASRGTADMIRAASECGLPTHVYRFSRGH